MFKIPNTPSPQAEHHELADFAELICWDRGSVSEREIMAALGRIDDNNNNGEGCDDDADEAADTLDEVMNEIERRANACGNGYPFTPRLEGTTLRYAQDTAENPRSIIYRYLLLSTRLNMKSDRVHDGLDGTQLLEKLSAHVLRNYLGGGKAKALVFGTSIGGNFQQRVEHMCRSICEGSGFRSLDDAPINAQDDKLDAVAWVPFTDSLAGQVIIFGQCKTGSNWSGFTDQLQPGHFIKKWMREPYTVDPIRAFCISEAMGRSNWKGICVSAGIILDRCRLVDFSDGTGPELLNEITRWTAAAKETVRFEMPKKRRRRNN